MDKRNEGRGWRRDGAWVAALLAAGGAGGASLAALLGGSSTPGLFLHGLALAGVAGALMQARRARLWADKVSTEIDAFSTRLVSLEGRLSSPDRNGAGNPAIRSNLAEVTGEIALLGNLVRDLAITVSAHERDVADLKDRAEARPVPSAEPAVPTPSFRPAPQPLPELPAREPVLVLPEPAGRPVAAADSAPVPVLAAERTSVADVADKRRIAAIVEAFEADRIELHLQPVVQLPQRKVRFYEALARLRLADDTVLVPAEFLSIVERVGLVAELDRRVVGRACVVARHLLARGSEALVSCNLSPRSVAEPGFLRSIGRIFDAHPDVAGRLVLEVSQRCWRTLDAERAGALAALRDRGVPFALDRAADARLDPLALADRGVRYLKLPADLILRPDAGRGLDIEAGDLTAVLARAGIRLVAEQVEREEDVPDLIDLDVPLAQGFVFAPPRAVRSDVVASPAGPEPVRATQAPADPVASPPAAPSPSASVLRPVPQPLSPAADAKLPYRAFLRRAG